MPFPGSSGQQQRVANTLKSLRCNFNVTFLTLYDKGKYKIIEKELLKYCDEVILIPSLYHKSILHKIFYKIFGYLYAFIYGLKSSNFIIGGYNSQLID